MGTWALGSPKTTVGIQVPHSLLCLDAMPATREQARPASCDAPHPWAQCAGANESSLHWACEGLVRPARRIGVINDPPKLLFASPRGKLESAKLLPAE